MFDSFEYTVEWYSTEYIKDWIGKCNSSDDLIKRYAELWKTRHGHKFREFFKEVHLDGKVLELGFNSGKTTYWLSKRYKNIEIDAVDFNEGLRDLAPLMFKVNKQLKNVWIRDCRSIDREDGYYDSIISLDFFEHLPEDVYFESLAECKRLLKVGGRLFVFFGKGDLAEHINVRQNRQVIRELRDMGFGFRNKKSGMMIFEKES